MSSLPRSVLWFLNEVNHCVYLMSNEIIHNTQERIARRRISQQGRDAARAALEITYVYRCALEKVRKLKKISDLCNEILSGRRQNPGGPAPQGGAQGQEVPHDTPTESDAQPDTRPNGARTHDPGRLPQGPQNPFSRPCTPPQESDPDMNDVENSMIERFEAIYKLHSITPQPLNPGSLNDRSRRFREEKQEDHIYEEVSGYRVSGLGGETQSPEEHIYEDIDALGLSPRTEEVHSSLDPDYDEVPSQPEGVQSRHEHVYKQTDEHKACVYDGLFQPYQGYIYNFADNERAPPSTGEVRSPQNRSDENVERRRPSHPNEGPQSCKDNTYDNVGHPRVSRLPTPRYHQAAMAMDEDDQARGGGQYGNIHKRSWDDVRPHPKNRRHQEQAMAHALGNRLQFHGETPLFQSPQQPRHRCTVTAQLKLEVQGRDADHKHSGECSEQRTTYVPTGSDRQKEQARPRRRSNLPQEDNVLPQTEVPRAIRHQQGYVAKEREVEMRNGSYFDIAEETKRPFSFPSSRGFPAGQQAKGQQAQQTSQEDETSQSSCRPHLTSDKGFTSSGNAEAPCSDPEYEKLAPRCIQDRLGPQTTRQMGQESRPYYQRHPFHSTQNPRHEEQKTRLFQDQRSASATFDFHRLQNVVGSQRQGRTVPRESRLDHPNPQFRHHHRANQMGRLPLKNDRPRQDRDFHAAKATVIEEPSMSPVYECIDETFVGEIYQSESHKEEDWRHQRHTECDDLTHLLLQCWLSQQGGLDKQRLDQTNLDCPQNQPGKGQCPENARSKDLPKNSTSRERSGQDGIPDQQQEDDNTGDCPSQNTLTAPERTPVGQQPGALREGQNWLQEQGQPDDLDEASQSGDLSPPEDLTQPFSRLSPFRRPVQRRRNQRDH